METAGNSLLSSYVSMKKDMSLHTYTDCKAPISKDLYVLEQRKQTEWICKALCFSLSSVKIP